MIDDMDEENAGEPTSSQRHSFRALRHQLLGKLLEIVLTPVDVIVESEIQVMSEPPKADVLLLRRGASSGPRSSVGCCQMVYQRSQRPSPSVKV